MTVSHGKPYAGKPHVRFDEGAGVPDEGRSALLHGFDWWGCPAKIADGWVRGYGMKAEVFSFENGSLGCGWEVAGSVAVTAPVAEGSDGTEWCLWES